MFGYSLIEMVLVDNPNLEDFFTRDISDLNALDLDFLKEPFNFTFYLKPTLAPRNYPKITECSILLVCSILGLKDHLKFILNKFPELKDTLKDYNYVIISTETVQNKDIDMARDLLSILSHEEKTNAVKKNSYAIISGFTHANDFEMVQHLLSLLTDAEIKDALKADNYSIIGHCINTNNMQMLEYLFSFLNDEAEINSAITSLSETIFHHMKILNAPVINYFLRYNSMFEHANLQPTLANNVARYVQATLAELRADKEAAKRSLAFDVSKSKAEHCFFILRHLIQKSNENPALLKDIEFLLSIPNVKAISHTASTNNPDNPFRLPNELLSLAQKIGNQPAAELLLTCPLVALFSPQKQPTAFEQKPITQERFFTKGSEPTKHEEKQNPPKKEALPALMQTPATQAGFFTKENEPTKHEEKQATPPLPALEQTQVSASPVNNVIEEETWQGDRSDHHWGLVCNIL